MSDPSDTVMTCEGGMNMHITTHADIDVVALQHADEITYLLEVTAPETNQDVQRAAQTIVVVLDRSGSMAGGRLDSAKTALVGLVERLDSDDVFGLVVFDDQAQVIVPADKLANHDVASLKQAIRAVQTGGCTDLSAGYLLGLREAGNVASEGGSTVIVLSDGRANRGIVDSGALGAQATSARTRGITTSTIGIGRDYDEHLIEALARMGSGSHTCAINADESVVQLSAAVDGLLEKSVLNAEIRLRPDPQAGVQAIVVHNQIASWAQGDDIVLAVGDLYAGESRKVVFSMQIGEIGRLGLAQVGECLVRFTALPDLADHKLTIPLVVNVVPGDEATHRIPDPVVVVERAIAEGQKAKTEASDLMGRGESDAAIDLLNHVGERLAGTAELLSSSTDPKAKETWNTVQEEVSELRRLAEVTRWDTIGASKEAMVSFNAMSQGKRERTTRPRKHLGDDDDGSTPS